MPVFESMELKVTLLFEIAQVVEFWDHEKKDHTKNKAIMGTLSTEFDQLAKENLCPIKVLKDWVEKLSSFEQTHMRKMTQDLETAQKEV